MNKPKPISGDTNSNESVLYTRRISVPSLTLNKDDFNDLKLIIEKTGQTPAFELETEKESLAFVDTQSLGNQKWPSNIERFTFQTEYYKPRIKGYIVSPDANNRSEITLEGYDRDWVSARTDELNRFLYEHRNFHYIFHTFKYAFSQAFILAGLLIYWLITYGGQRDWGAYTAIPAIASYCFVFFLYTSLLPKCFPYLVLQPEFPTFHSRLRNALKFFIPAVFVGLVVQSIMISA